MTNKFRLVDYYDVWGSEEEGYEVNGCAIIEDDIYLDDDLSDEEIIDFLCQIEYLLKNDSKLFDIYNDGDMIEIYVAKTGLPLCRLEREF